MKKNPNEIVFHTCSIPDGKFKDKQMNKFPIINKVEHTFKDEPPSEKFEWSHYIVLGLIKLQGLPRVPVTRFFRLSGAAVILINVLFFNVRKKFQLEDQLSKKS